MAESSTHISYSFEDIQRYLQGKMSASEMHNIEKAALQDPFLADAIEGFNEVDLSAAKQHLNEINASLQAEKQQTKVVAFNKRTQWLKVAALIIVLAGIGIVASYFLRTSSNQQTEIAKVQQQPVINETARDSATVIDNTNALNKPDSDLLIAENNIVKKVQPPTEKKKAAEKNVADDNTIVKEDKPGIQNAEVATLSAAPPAEEKIIMSRSLATADTLMQLQGKASGISVLPTLPPAFSGKLINENNDPVPFAFIHLPGKNEGVLTDANGTFTWQKNDSILKVTIDAMGYESKVASLKAGSNNFIVLKGTEPTLNEVVVTASGYEKNQNQPAALVGGWEKFYDYVYTQVNKDSSSTNFMNIDYSVEIEFLVDKAGNPYNFNIIKSLDDQHNAKAIDILKSGPKWKQRSNKKAKITISFQHY